MSNGSGLFSSQRAYKPHLVEGKGGVAGEVDDLRADVLHTLAPLVALTVEEFTNPPAADTNAFKLSIATSTDAQSYSGAALDGVVGTAALAYPRVPTVTTNNHPATWAGNVTFNGLDANGVARSVVLALADNTTVVGTEALLSVTSIDVDAQVDALGTMEFGFGAPIGLAKPIKVRSGLAQPILEIMDGSVVGGGTSGAATTAVNQNEAAHTHGIAAATATNAAMLVAGGHCSRMPIAAELVSIVAAADSADGAMVIAAQPDVPRKVQVSIVEGGAPITAGIGTLVGVAWDGTALSEVFDLTGGAKVMDSTNAYASVTSFTVSGLVGGGAATTISLGVDVALALPIPAGATNVTVFGAFVDGVKEAVGVVDATARTVTPTTAANGARVFDFNFRYTVTPTQAAHDHGAATGAGSAHTHVQDPHTHAPGGTFANASASAPNGLYTPTVAPNGAHDYTLVYEYTP